MVTCNADDGFPSEWRGYSGAQRGGDERWKWEELEKRMKEAAGCRKMVDVYM